MIQNKMLHECVLYMRALLWFMAEEQHTDITLYLSSYQVPSTPFHLKSSG